MATITTTALRIARNGRTLLDEVDLTLEGGEVLGILGANGTGKSSLLAVLSGELAAAGGSVQLDRKALGTHGAAGQARRRAVLPQHAAPALQLAVSEIVDMGAYPFPELTPRRLATLRERALRDAGVLDMADAFYPHLSGGEQQRVQFARALLQCLAATEVTGLPACLLLDEPTSNLDPQHQHGILRAAQTLARETGAAVLAVLHDINLAARWCDRIALIVTGRCYLAQPPAQALTPTRLEAAYGLPMQVMPHPADPARPLVFCD